VTACGENTGEEGETSSGAPFLFPRRLSTSLGLQTLWFTLHEAS